MTILNDRIIAVIDVMKREPRALLAYLEKPGPDFDVATTLEVAKMIDQILSDDPNDLHRLGFKHALLTWDNEKDAAWVNETKRNTKERRKIIHKKLGSDADLEQRIDSLFPHFPLEEPVIISDGHKAWYRPIQGIGDYYWASYIKYLKKNKGWEDESLLSLDNSTRAIVECLANPEAPEAYASRGLVMGYVQSGKTANFMGVAARAADAGYRLIIVLAGTWNILRKQTQRRFDKELLGKQLLSNDAFYRDFPPDDWPDFLEHEAEPGELGHYSWQRLTRLEFDFKRLESGIESLEYIKQDKAKALHSPENLHAMPVKLLVIKKHSKIIANLVKDLKRLNTKIENLPALIIDDESDQAGLNTVNPKKIINGKTRNPTNAAIVNLLALFPRGQYIGYTATPYANVLVDPEDSQDIFPKDFIISLDRPLGYMGVLDFFDPMVSYDDLDKNDYSLPEIAYIRRVRNSLGNDSVNLKNAICSYVLAGAIKLFRHKRDPVRYKENYYRHHTMLIHTSQLKGAHLLSASVVEGLWEECAFNSPKGKDFLEELWIKDYSVTSACIGNEIIPDKFNDLIPYLSEAISKIQKNGKPYLILNGDSEDVPDFGAQAIWKIFIGGNKLSRGYTIEGLTISYYRRISRAADTLMQMGRWFGFRPGYRDLVRVYLGVVEGKSDSDLVSLFKEICRMEEEFRNEVERYVRIPGKETWTPKQIPPLISLFGNIPPTSSKKMFNARIDRRNFGGSRVMPTLVASKGSGKTLNFDGFKKIIENAQIVGMKFLTGNLNTGKKINSHSFISIISSTVVIATFLREFRWSEDRYKETERPQNIQLLIEFIEKEMHGINSWIIVAPQRKNSFGPSLEISEDFKLSVKMRTINGNSNVDAYGEPEQRFFGNYLAGITGEKSEITKAGKELLLLKKEGRAVLQFYFVRSSENDDEVTVGFEVFIPPNKLEYRHKFSSRKNDDSVSVTVS